MNISSSATNIASSLFSKLDTKNKGYLDKADLQKALETLDSNSDTSSSDLDAVFNKIDVNQDGKVTKSELTTSINNLFDQLNAQFNSTRASRPPPPPPPDDKNDAGYTKDELAKIASTTDDSKLSSLMNKIAANFAAADTNEDGKVSAQEAMTFERSTQAKSTESTSTKAPIDQQSLATIMKIAQLIQAYGLDSNSATTSSISTAA